MTASDADPSVAPSPETPPPAAPAEPRPWLRGVFMVIFVVVFAVAETVLAVIALVQFGWMIAYRKPHPMLRRFGDSLSQWIAGIVRFQTAATEAKPFPWGEWPAPREDAGA